MANIFLTCQFAYQESVIENFLNSESAKLKSQPYRNLSSSEDLAVIVMGPHYTKELLPLPPLSEPSFPGKSGSV